MFKVNTLCQKDTRQTVTAKNPRPRAEFTCDHRAGNTQFTVFFKPRENPQPSLEAQATLTSRLMIPSFCERGESTEL